jgi:nitroreductase/dihydropteridine reductase
MTFLQSHPAQEEVSLHGEELIQLLNWRYATKRMNGQIVPQPTLERILECIRLSASSFGLQPYTIIVIENRELLGKMKSAANNQPKITEASHMLVFAAWESLIQKKIDDYINQIATERGVSHESLQKEKSMMESQMAFSHEHNLDWAARQAYLALGTGLIAAAAEGVDSCPMEGFNPSAMDAVLGLREKGLRSVALMALGYRDAEKDPLANAKKIRRHKEELFIRM